MKANSQQIRYLGVVTNGGTPTPDEENWDGEVPWATPIDLGRVNGGVLGETERSITRAGLAGGSRAVRPDSLLVSTRAPVGYVARVERTTAFNQGCRAITPRRGVDSRFLVFALMSAQDELELRSNGTTFKELSTIGMKEVRLPCPPLEDQRAIARYLDRETARLDELIAEQERLMHALAERRRAAVLGAVSEGAHESSGRRLKHSLIGVRQGWSPQCDNQPAIPGQEWAVLKTGCVNRGAFRPEENKRLPDELQPRPETVVRQGEVVVCRASTRELVGSAAVVDGDYPRLMLSDKLYALEFDPQLAVPEFVALRMGTDRLRGLIELHASGASHSMQNITQAAILNLPMPLPSVQDQRRVLARLRLTTGKIDDLTAECRELITLLKERRSALITAAVTGKIDVRNSV